MNTGLEKINKVLSDAIAMEASDVHITDGASINFRIDGSLRPYNEEVMTPRLIDELITPLFEDKPSIREKLEANGEVDFAYSITGKSRFRVNVYYGQGVLGAVMRLLPYDIPTPAMLGLPDAVRELANLRRGLVLVTGQTGVGKSTTLASLISEINKKYSSHIITIEDPIEYLHIHNKSIVDQRELGMDTKSFSSALRAALRQDPDVILVGEMRDLDTIATAITAAETGHLVFSTVHTNDAASTIDRVIDVFPPHQQEQIRVQLSNVLEAVVSQQLLPDVSGKGRIAAFEVMISNPAIRNLIRENKSYQIPSQIQTNKRIGMRMMDDSLYELYVSGRISAEDCCRYAHDQLAMNRKIYY